MRKVIFSENIKSIKVEGLPDNTLVVVHDMYDKPDIKGNFIDWNRFKGSYTDYDPDQYVIVGVNRMITPSNRCDMVNDYLQILTRNKPKVVIDTSPFIGEPWRVWFHYSIAFGEWLGADYSYPIEGDWLKWFLLESNFSKLSADSLPLLITGTESTLNKLTAEFSFYEINDFRMQYYSEVKKMVFEKYGSPKLLIINMLKHLNKYFGVELDFDSYRSNKKITVPDVGIYRHVVQENIRRMNIYNCFT